MPLIPAFHEVRFPTDIAFGSSGGPERRTEIVTLGSGGERRNARWADARRRYDAGYGVRSLADLDQAIQFFEERRGRLFGFRWRDRMDDASAPPGVAIAATDQKLGTGDGETAVFQLSKTYGALHAPFERMIAKPVDGSVLVAIDGAPLDPDAFAVDPTTGRVTFSAPPDEGVELTAGFRFDVPVRFDTDHLVVNLAAFEAGDIPSIPIVEIRP